MCGIVGYVGKERCVEVLLDGLKNLEYRGYDSAGSRWPCPIRAASRRPKR
jgi:glucosamine--fructose-6-phosphate aminotransferase (isomerizing)